MGHIDFTIGANGPLVEFIIDTLRKTCENEDFEDDGEEVAELEVQSSPILSPRSENIISEPGSPESPPAEFSLLGT